MPEGAGLARLGKGAVKEPFALLRRAPRESARLALFSLLAAASEGAGLMLLVPLLEAGAGDTGALPAPLAPLAQWPLPLLLSGFVLAIAVRGLVEALRALAAQDLRVRIGDSLRGELLEALLASEWRALARQSQAQVRALFAATLDRVGEAVLVFADGLRAAAYLGALGLAALAISPRAALVGLVCAVLLALIQRPLRRWVRELGRRAAGSQESIHLALGETLAALRLIKGHGRESAETARVMGALAQLRQDERRYIVTAAAARALFQTGAAAILAAGFWIALARWSMPLAMLVPLALVALRAVPLLAALQQAMHDWHHAAPALGAAREVIREAEAAREPGGDSAPAHLREKIEFRDIHLDHAPGRQALRGVSAAVPAGSLTALVGPSGAGKSSLADIAAGLIAPDRGTMLIDGIPLGPAARADWRRKVAHVHQDSVLFSGTIRDNLLWAAPGAEDERLAAALTQAAAGFVFDLPQGLDTAIGQGAGALSGGERQRIALARALLLDPLLLILDEATSAVDPEAERAIVGAVRALAGRCTVLLVGHRGALAKAASHRIELVQGQVNAGLERNSP